MTEITPSPLNNVNTIDDERINTSTAWFAAACGQGAPNLRNVTQYYYCFFSAAAAPVRRTPG